MKLSRLFLVSLLLSTGCASRQVGLGYQGATLSDSHDAARWAVYHRLLSNDRAEIVKGYLGAGEMAEKDGDLPAAAVAYEAAFRSSFKVEGSRLEQEKLRVLAATRLYELKKRQRQPGPAKLYLILAALAQTYIDSPQGTNEHRQYVELKRLLAEQKAQIEAQKSAALSQLNVAIWSMNAQMMSNKAAGVTPTFDQTLGQLTQVTQDLAQFAEASSAAADAMSIVEDEEAKLAAGSKEEIKRLPSQMLHFYLMMAEDAPAYVSATRRLIGDPESAGEATRRFLSLALPRTVRTTGATGSGVATGGAELDLVRKALADASRSENASSSVSTLPEYISAFKAATREIASDRGTRAAPPSARTNPSSFDRYPWNRIGWSLSVLTVHVGTLVHGETKLRFISENERVQPGTGVSERPRFSGIAEGSPGLCLSFGNRPMLPAAGQWAGLTNVGLGWRYADARFTERVFGLELQESYRWWEIEFGVQHAVGRSIGGSGSPVRVMPFLGFSYGYNVFHTAGPDYVGAHHEPSDFVLFATLLGGVLVNERVRLLANVPFYQHGIGGTDLYERGPSFVMTVSY